MNTNKAKWIQTSYLMAANSGIEKLSVNVISRQVGVSKSSFYHFFTDISDLKAALLEHHLVQTKKFAANISAAQLMDPDLINIFYEHKTDVLFHKRLRVNRKDATYGHYMEKAYNTLERALYDQWTAHFDLGNQRLFSENLLKFVSEHFLLSITTEDYTKDWLKEYLKSIAELLNQIQKK